jgi:hypothetical protein
VDGTENKECSRCIFAEHFTNPENGLGSCDPKYIPNCRFHHYSAYSTATGCELCEKSFRVIYSEDVNEDGKKFGRCESIGSNAIKNCWLYRTEEFDNSSRCYVCETGYVANDTGSACEKLTSS